MHTTHAFRVEHFALGTVCEPGRPVYLRIRNVEGAGGREDPLTSGVDSDLSKRSGHSRAGGKGFAGAGAGKGNARVPSERARAIYLGSGRGGGAPSRGDFRVFTGSCGTTRIWRPM